MHSSWVFFLFPFIVRNVSEGQPLIARESATIYCHFLLVLVTSQPVLIPSWSPPCAPPLRGECPCFSCDARRLAVEKPGISKGLQISNCSHFPCLVLLLGAELCLQETSKLVRPTSGKQRLLNCSTRPIKVKFQRRQQQAILRLCVLTSCCFSPSHLQNGWLTREACLSHMLRASGWLPWDRGHLAGAGQRQARAAAWRGHPGPVAAPAAPEHTSPHAQGQWLPEGFSVDSLVGKEVAELSPNGQLRSCINRFQLWCRKLNKEVNVELRE